MFRLCALVLLLAVPFLPAKPVSAAPAASASERELVKEINRVRAARNLAPLRIDPVLNRAARSHSRDMLRRKYFAHGDFGSRMQRFGAKGPRLGENLAWTSTSSETSRKIVRMWLNSPGHRANLLRPGYRRVGVGVSVGTFSGVQSASIATANFAGT